MRPLAPHSRVPKGRLRPQTKRSCCEWGGHRLHGRLLRSSGLRPGWSLGGRCSFRTWRRYPVGGSLPHRLLRARSDGSPIPCEERGAIDQQHQCSSLDGDGSGAWPRAHGFLSRSCLAPSPELLRRISGDQDWLTVLNEPFTTALRRCLNRTASWPRQQRQRSRMLRAASP